VLLIPRTAPIAALASLAILAGAPAGAEASDGNGLVPEGLPKVPGVDLDRVVEDVRQTIPEPVSGRVPKPPASPAGPPARRTPAPADSPSQSPGRPTVVPQAPVRRSGDERASGSAPARSGPVARSERRPDARERRVSSRAAGSEQGTPSPKPRETGGRPEERSLSRVVTDIVNVLPRSVRTLVAALGSIALLAAFLWLLVRARIRRLGPERDRLLRDAGLLKDTLLPPVPDQLGPVSLWTAGGAPGEARMDGHFSDVFGLDGRGVAVILGDVTRDHSEPLSRAAITRHALRAYLRAGLAPAAALQVATEACDGLSAIVAIYDEAHAMLTYACVGHPPPIITRPTTSCAADSTTLWSPFRSVMVRDQATAPLPPGSVACFYTDGGAANVADLGGRRRLVELIDSLHEGDTARGLMERVEAEHDQVSGRLATCLIRAGRAANADASAA
jgi:Stage II sporulation protein E (SpoIIE)